MPIDSLLDTQLDCEDVPSCMTQLYSQLEMDAAFPCITKTDLQLVKAWIQDLGTVNYSLPRLRSRKRFAYLTQGGKLSASTVPRLVGSGPGHGSPTIPSTSPSAPPPGTSSSPTPPSSRAGTSS